MTIELTDEQIEKVIDVNMTIDDAVEFLRATDGGIDYAITEFIDDGFIPHYKTAEMITYHNCHDIARAIYLNDAKAAKGLSEELLYWLKSRPVGIMK